MRRRASRLRGAGRAAAAASLREVVDLIVDALDRDPLTVAGTVKLSDYVAQFLVDQGVKHVFMLVGGAAMHLNDSIGGVRRSRVRLQPS